MEPPLPSQPPVLAPRKKRDGPQTRDFQNLPLGPLSTIRDAQSPTRNPNKILRSMHLSLSPPRLGEDPPWAVL